MIKSEDLGDWRRTHLLKDLNEDLIGKEIQIMGWVSSIRHQGGIVFIILRDRDGLLQVTCKENNNKKIFDSLVKIKPFSCLAVKGELVRENKAPKGIELIPKEVKVLALAKKQPPFPLYSKKLHNLDQRLDLRAVDLRRPIIQAIFRIRKVALESFREFLRDKGYMEINTPKIIATATEGGANLFPILYYDKEAFLIQSPQLYKEQLVMAFDKVYEIASAFRAEKSKTLSHLSEFLSVDVEEAFVDYKDIMKVCEELTYSTLLKVKEKCKEELEYLGVNLNHIKYPYPRLSYDEIVEELENLGHPLNWGEDLSSSHLDALGKRYNYFYFIYDWPSQIKPFYIKSKRRNSKICESFDLMFGPLEIASGGTRLNSKSQLIKKLKERGLKPKSFEYHLKVFDYGMPPHAGFGLGFERYLMVLTGVNNIREVTFFPRDQFRLIP